MTKNIKSFIHHLVARLLLEKKSAAAENGGVRRAHAPRHTDYKVVDPMQFPRYIVSYLGGGNSIISKEEWDSYEGVENTHRYMQHCPFPGCNTRLSFEGELLPECSKEFIDLFFSKMSIERKIEDSPHVKTSVQSNMQNSNCEFEDA